MAPRGYTNKYLVADAIGKHDGVAPVQSLDLLIEAAEDWVDKRAGRSWLASTITGEPHTLNGDSRVIWLRQTPVTAITGVSARTVWVGAQVQTLLPTAYELLDPQRGEVIVSGEFYGARLTVDYTATNPLPADIQLATTLLVVSWCKPMINGGPSMADGIKAYTIGQDLSVTFQDAGTQTTLAAPIEVLRIVDQYRPLVFA